MAIFDVETLELRRLKTDLMYIFIILFGLIIVEPDTLEVMLVAHSPGWEFTAMRRRDSPRSFHSQNTLGHEIVSVFVPLTLNLYMHLKNPLNKIDFCSTRHNNNYRVR